MEGVFSYPGAWRMPTSPWIPGCQDGMLMGSSTKHIGLWTGLEWPVCRTKPGLGRDAGGTPALVRGRFSRRQEFWGLLVLSLIS